MSDSAHLCDESDEASAVNCWLSLAATKGYNKAQSLEKKTFFWSRSGEIYK